MAVLANSLVLGYFKAVGYRAVPYPPFAQERPALLLNFLARARVDHGVVAGMDSSPKKTSKAFHHSQLRGAWKTSRHPSN
jgi:hypothetical protein